MRTNIEIDDDLMRRAMAASGAPTKKAAVEEGLRLLVRRAARARVAALFGAVDWQGDLDAMRRDAVPGALHEGAAPFDPAR